MQQQNNLQPGSKRTKEYQLGKGISLVTFLDDNCTTRYIIVDRTKQLNGQPNTYTRFTDNKRFTIKEFYPRYEFCIKIGTGDLFFFDQARRKWYQCNPRPMNETLTYVDNNGNIHCLDLTQGCNRWITDNNLIFFFNSLPLYNEAEKYKILSALIALNIHNMKLKLPQYTASITTYKAFLEHMIGLNRWQWRDLLKICAQFGSCDGLKEVGDVVNQKKLEMERLRNFGNNNTICYSYGNQNNMNYNQQNFGNNNIKYFKYSYYIPLLNKQVVAEWKYDTIRKQLVFLSIDGTRHNCQHINNGGDFIAYYNGVYCKILFNEGYIKILRNYDSIPLAIINASTGAINVNPQQVNNNYNIYNNQNNVSNFGNNNSLNVVQPTIAAAVEQGQVGAYDEDTKLLMDVLNNGGKLKDNGFVINPEDGGGQSITKNGKVLFKGKFDQKNHQLVQGTLNVKFKDGKPTEYYVGKFKDNLFEDTQGIYVFEERYNTGKQERFEGNFSKGKPHGQVTFYDANGLKSEYEYDHGKIISIEGFRDMHDTDVIVFDSAISFQDAYTDRYANNFHIVAQEVYDKKKEQIFGQRKDDVKMPTANEKPNNKQQKMMEFIQKYILIKEPLGGYQQDYISVFCSEKHLIEILKEHGDKWLQKPEKDFVAKMKKDFFGDDQRPISELIGKNNELREKWLCFVVDKIGMRAFNEMYAMENLNHFVEKIKNNGNKKLKVVFSNHGSSSLHLFQDNEVFSAKWMDRLMATIKGLKRDTYVVNQSCYGGEKMYHDASFDKCFYNLFGMERSEFIFKHKFNIKDVYVKNSKLDEILKNNLLPKLETFKNKHGDRLSKFKQLMYSKKSISFASNYIYIYNAEKINYKLDCNLKKFMPTLFGVKEKCGIFFKTDKPEPIVINTEYLQNNGLSPKSAITMSLLKNLNNHPFFENGEMSLHNGILEDVDKRDLFEIPSEFQEFYKFLDEKYKQPGADRYTIAKAEQEFVKQRLEQKCKKIGIDYQQFEEFEKDFEELENAYNEIVNKYQHEWQNKIHDSIYKFSKNNNLLDQLLKLEDDCEKEISKFAEIDELPSDDEINKTIQYIEPIIRETKDKITNGFNKVLNELKGEKYQDFIQNNFKDLYDFCVNNKDIKFENIFDRDGLLSQQNLITLFSKVKQTIIDRCAEIEKNITKENMRQIINNQQTLKKKLMLLKQEGFGNKIVYSKNLNNKNVHYTDQKRSRNGKSVSNSEHHMMYYIIDKNGKMKPLVKDVDGFKQKLKEFEEKLEKERTVKISGQNFDQEYHSPETIDKLINDKFQDLKKYINEAKANKNIILGYNQPKDLGSFKQTVDENGNAIINNTKTNINLSVDENPQFATVTQIKEEIPTNTYYHIEHKEPEYTKKPEGNLTNVNNEPEDTKEPQDNTQHKYVKDGINKEQLTNNNNYNTNENLLNSNNQTAIYNNNMDRNTNIIN